MQKRHQKLLGLRSSALIEIALFLVVALLADILLFGGTRFLGVEPHPFWVIILLVACQYGTAEALVAVVACSLVLLVGNLPPQAISQNLYDYLFAVVKTPLLWLVVAVGLGELRQRHRRERDYLQDELDDSREREEKIAQSYQWTRDLKEKLELRIAGNLRGSVAAYQAARAMESLDNTQVLRGLEELIGAVMNPGKFSIFLLEDAALTLSVNHGWRATDSFARAYPVNSDLYRAVIGERRLVCAVNPDQQRTLADQGLLAGPIVDNVTGNVLGMIKIEDIGFTDLHLSSIETFAALCQWAGAALSNARKYAVSQEGSIVNPDHNLLTSNYFQRHAQFVSALAKRVGFEVNMVFIKLAGGELEGETRLKAGRALSTTVDKVLRSVDLAFDYQGTNEEYSVVLPATDRRGAEIVLDKIRGGLSADPAARGVNFTYSIQTLQGKA